MNTAVVVGGGGFQGLPVLRGLHAIGWRTIVADSVPESLNRYEADGFHLMPEAKHYDAFRKEMLLALRLHVAKAVFPTTMYDLPVLAMLRPELEGIGIRVFASSPALVALLSDKMQTMSASVEAGLSALPLLSPEDHDYSYPLIGKPRQGWGGLGIARVSTAASWQDLKKSLSTADYIWQRQLPDFAEWSVDFAIARGGERSPLVCRRRIRSSGGYAVISDIAISPCVESLAHQTVSWLIDRGGYGLFNIQILEEPDGSLWLSDINPRPGTSSVCALSAGVNLVEFLLADAPPQRKVRPGIVIRTLSERFLPRPSQRIRGVVLDLDETLICQKSWMYEKLKQVLTAFPVSVEAKQLARFRLEAIRIIDEGPWHQLINLALTRAGLPPSLAGQIIDLWRTIHPEHVVTHQDAAAFIRGLQAQKVPIALLTDNPAASQQQKIARLPRDISFKSIILTDTLSAPKPDPRGFLAAAAGLSLPPETLLMVGDSPWRDGAGAVRAGYAGALIIRRNGSMTNALPSLFEHEYPDTADRISWADSLYGAERILDLIE